MTDAPPSTANALSITLIVAGVLLAIAALIIYILNSPEAWLGSTNDDLDHREATLRLLVFTALPGAILLGLGIPLKRLQGGVQ